MGEFKASLFGLSELGQALLSNARIVYAKLLPYRRRASLFLVVVDALMGKFRAE